MRKVAYLQITRDCNNECIFCSNPKIPRQLTLNEAKKQIDLFKNEGMIEILLTGGEPTIVQWLPDIIRYIKSIELNPRVITNGVNLADKKSVYILADCGLKDINISIHTSDEQIAEKLSGKKGHLQKTLTAIKNCLQAGITVNINCTINSLNCKRLSKDFEYFTNEFPEVNHYVLNNLDPGKSDGHMNSRAADNPWIVAKLADIELELSRTAKLLQARGKTFRVERVPLCYMTGFWENSTETRKIIKEEMYVCSFIEKNSSIIRRVSPAIQRTKSSCCSECMLNSICAGIQQEYLQIHGSSELYPVFADPNIIRNNILMRKMDK